MKFEIEHTLKDYIRIGYENSEEVLSSKSSLLEAIMSFDVFFRTELWAGKVGMSPTQAFLSMNSYMVYLSAIRIALTGHVASIYPLFRTALESACYAFMIGHEPSLDEIWSSRHKSSDALKLSRKKFNSAVLDTGRIIESKGSVGSAAWINDCYQSAIDFGAHPNPKSIYNHLRLPEDRKDEYVFGLTGLHHADSFEMNRGLMACLDFGLVIAVILSHSIKEPTECLSKALFRINELKELVTIEHFPDMAQQ